MRDIVPTKLNQFGGKFRPDIRPIFGLDHGFHFFSKFLIRHTKHGNIHHLRMGYQEVFRFLGVDVDPTGDNHKALAICQVKVAVGV